MLVHGLSDREVETRRKPRFQSQSAEYERTACSSPPADGVRAGGKIALGVLPSEVGDEDQAMLDKPLNHSAAPRHLLRCSPRGNCAGAGRGGAVSAPAQRRAGPGHSPELSVNGVWAMHGWLVPLRWTFPQFVTWTRGLCCPAPC